MSILLSAVVVGLVSGCFRAHLKKQPLCLPPLHLTGLVFLSFILQLVAFYWPATRVVITNPMAAVLLVSSQCLFLIFALCNCQHPGFRLLALGAMLNFLVIVANGGFMPLNADIVQSKIPEAGCNWTMGSRFNQGKDVVLPITEIKLWWLSDWLLLPLKTRYVVFSPGDIFLSIGAFMTLWSLGKDDREKLEQCGEPALQTLS